MFGQSVGIDDTNVSLKIKRRILKHGLKSDYWHDNIVKYVACVFTFLKVIGYKWIQYLDSSPRIVAYWKLIYSNVQLQGGPGETAAYQT